MDIRFVAEPDRRLIQMLIAQSKGHDAMGDFELQFDSEQTFVVGMKLGDTIVAGAVGVVSCEWAYLETLWVDNTLRGQGIGRTLMCAVESYAEQLGLNGIYLYTTDFQAPAFYSKIGYTVMGRLPNRPQGYTASYFYKTELGTDGLTDDFFVEHPVTEVTFDYLEQALIDHADAVEPIVALERVFLWQDTDGTCHGGLFGHEFWGWLDVHLLYADATTGVIRLLEALEAYCDRRELGIVLITYEPAQQNLLSERGYQVFGELPERPSGQTSICWIRAGSHR